MIIDAANLFSYNQSMAQAVGSYDSTNTIDVGEPSGVPTSAQGGGARDLGIGAEPALYVHVSQPGGYTSGGAATIQVSVQGAPDNGAGAPGAYTPYATSPAIPLANLANPGRIWDVVIPRAPVGAPTPRFYKLVYTIAGAAFTAGLITSELVLDRPARPTSGEYPAGLYVQN